MLTFSTARRLNDFVTCTMEDGLNFIATSNDIIIMRNMYVNCRTWEENEMKLFYELAHQFYQIDDSTGLFLDLGANIGTTGIYFTKKLTPNLKLLAFEPDPENFKLLRANLILNDLEEKTVAENFGLGVEKSEQVMYRMPKNPGSNGMYTNLFLEDAPTEMIKIIQLDKYFAEKNLAAADIKYIWIDTEGFEPQVLLGMKNLLTENPAPIFMEFNPHLWKKSGFYEKMMELLVPLYSSYIFVPELVRSKKINVYPLEKLWEFQSTPSHKHTGDIFLIKNLSEVI